MARGHHVRTQPLRGPHECVELYLPVTEDVWIRRAAARVLVKHVVHDALAVFLAQVHEVEGDADLARDHLGHEPVLLPLAVSVQRTLGVMPVLHEHGKDIVALPLEQQGGYAGVHSAREADADFHGLEEFARPFLGEELGGVSHFVVVERFTLRGSIGLALPFELLLEQGKLALGVKCELSVLDPCEI